jgi:hypothetical protein
VVEIKSVGKLLPIHSAQLMTYMRLRRVCSGLLINFNVNILHQGIKRILSQRLSPWILRALRASVVSWIVRAFRSHTRAIANSHARISSTRKISASCSATRSR